MRGSIHKRIAKRSGTPRYDCIFRAGGKQVWRTFKTKKAADDFLATTVTDVNEGTFRRVTPLRLQDVFDKWTTAIEAAETLGQLKLSTRRSYVSVVKQHLAPAFGAIRSDQLTTAAVSAWKETVAAKVADGTIAPKTFNNCVGVLSSCLEWARDQHYLAAVPFPKKLRAPRQSTPRPIVQGAEIQRLWLAADAQDRLIVALALFAGLRRGEVFGLRWADVTWPKGRTRASLRVSQAFVQRKITTPKSAAGRRDVDLPARLVDLLQRHQKTRPPHPLDDGTAFVIRQENGQPVDPDNWGRRVWPTIRRAAKLPETVSLHALRHTFGSLMLANDTPIKHVSQQMGHANVAITMDVYQHVLKSTSAEATRQLDKHIPQGTAPRLRLVKKGAA
jgi:integrase